MIGSGWERGAWDSGSWASGSWELLVDGTASVAPSPGEILGADRALILGTAVAAVGAGQIDALGDVFAPVAAPSASGGSVFFNADPLHQRHVRAARRERPAFPRRLLPNALKPKQRLVIAGAARLSAPRPALYAKGAVAVAPAPVRPPAPLPPPVIPAPPPIITGRSAIAVLMGRTSGASQSHRTLIPGAARIPSWLGEVEARSSVTTSPKNPEHAARVLLVLAAAGEI